MEAKRPYSAIDVDDILDSGIGIDMLDGSGQSTLWGKASFALNRLTRYSDACRISCSKAALVKKQTSGKFKCSRINSY